MFNPAIQSYINSSGEAQAKMRAQQLDAYIDAIYPAAPKPAQNTPDIKAPFGAKPFNEVLKTSADSKQVFKLDEPPAIPFGALSVSGRNKKNV